MTGDRARCRIPPDVRGLRPDTGGRELDVPTRKFFSERLNYDFAGVRVHTDDAASASAQLIGARAYTLGSHVIFGRGQYAPATPDGTSLLAHELAHVVQQSGSGPAEPVAVAPADNALESEASRAAIAVASGAQAPILSSAPAGVVQAQFGALHAEEERSAAEKKLPVAFPPRGIKVVGSDASALVAILSSCTGLPLGLDSGGMLRVLFGPPNAGPGVSSAAARILRSILNDGSAGIVVDTSPQREGVVGGAFTKEAPGYHFIDVADVRVLGAPTGATGGATACDFVIHELSEAFAGRKASLATGVVGERAFAAAHAEGVKAEEAVRTEFGLPLRGAGGGDFQQMFQEPAPTGQQRRIFLESTTYGSGRALRTQLNLLRMVITLLPSGQPASATTDVIASHVVAGAVHFTTQRQAMETFNRFANQFGFRPVTIPPGVK